MFIAKSPLCPNASCFFFLSNRRLTNLLTLSDHFVGFIELSGRKWPIFVDQGFLCLKLDSFESLTSKFPVWIDSEYRIRLGTFSLDSKSQPVLHFTMMPITLPPSFKYACTISDQLTKATSSPKSASSSADTSGSDNTTTLPSQMDQSKPSMASWDDAAGICFVPRASNSLSCYGQIPHNFPVSDVHPKIVLDPWLPPFVHKIIQVAKQHHLQAMNTMNAASLQARKRSNSSKSNQKPK